MAGAAADAEVGTVDVQGLADRAGGGVQRQVGDDHGRGPRQALAVKAVQGRGRPEAADPARRRHHAPGGEVHAPQAEAVKRSEDRGQTGYRLLVGVLEQVGSKVAGHGSRRPGL